jgi:hypothetical protein
MLIQGILGDKMIFFSGCVLFLVSCPIWVLAFDTLKFCRKRDKALAEPLFSTGEIVGYKRVRFSNLNSRPDSGVNTHLCVKTPDGSLFLSPILRPKYLTQIVSEKVSIYKYNDFYYIDDIQLNPEPTQPNKNHIVFQEDLDNTDFVNTKTFYKKIMNNV